MVSKRTKPKLVISTTVLLPDGRLLANKFRSRNPHHQFLCKSSSSRGGQSHMHTENVLANHAMGIQALGCVWTLAFTILNVDCGTDGFRISDV